MEKEEIVSDIGGKIHHCQNKEREFLLHTFKKYTLYAHEKNDIRFGLETIIFKIFLEL